MLTCKEVTRAIASDELATAGWRQRGGVRLHLLRCRDCRRYAGQIRAIGTAVQTLFGRQEDDPGTLERLESAILESVHETKASSSEIEQ